MEQRRALMVAGGLTALVVATVLGTGARLGAFGLGDGDDGGRSAVREEQPVALPEAELAQIIAVQPAAPAPDATVLPSAVPAPDADQPFAGVGLDDQRFAEAIGAEPAPVTEPVYYDDDYDDDYDEDYDDTYDDEDYDDDYDDDDEREEHRERVSRGDREAGRSEREHQAERKGNSDGGVERLTVRRSERDHDDDD